MPCVSLNRFFFIQLQHIFYDSSGIHNRVKNHKGGYIFFFTPKILKSYIIPSWNCFWNYTCLHTIFSLCNHYILLCHYLSIPRSLCGIVKLLISNIVHFEKMEEAARFLFFVLKWIIANPKSNWQKSFSSQLHYLEKSGGQNAQQNGINICWLNFRK